MSRQVEYTALIRPKLPSRFIKSSQKRNGRARRAMGYDGAGPASRLLSVLEEPCFMQPHLIAHLGLSSWFRTSRFLYDHDAVKEAVEAIKAQTVSAVYYRFEATRTGKAHVHLIADGAKEFLELPRGGELVKPVYDLEKLMFYLAKPAVPAGEAALREYREALLQWRREGRAPPRISNYLRLPRKKAWLAARDSSFSETRVM